MNLIHHTVPLVRTVAASTPDSGYVGLDIDILVIVGFIKEERVDPQFIERHDLRSLFICQLKLCESLLYLFTLLFDLPLGIECLCRLFQHLEAFLVQIDIVSVGKRKQIEAAVGHDYRVEILVLYPVKRFGALFGTEVFAADSQDLRFRIH